MARATPRETTVGRNKNPQMNLRLSEVAREALDALAERSGLSATKVVETLVREKARKEGLRIKGLGS